MMRPVYFLGRLCLWVLFFPLGIWRSLVHHRKKAERRSDKRLADAVLESERRHAATRPHPEG